MQTPGRTVRARRIGTDAVLVAGLLVVLVGLFVWPTLSHGFVFPVGPDVPVYLWWARVAASEGLSLVGERPGAVAIIPAVGGALGLGLVPALAGLQYALGPAIGLAGAGLLRGRGSGARPAWLAGGFLAGVWATHLGGGFLANLAMAAPFVAAAAVLARRNRRGTVGAAVLLGGGGLAHPQFFAVGASVLLLTALWAAARDRRVSARSGDAGRVLAALGGGVLIAGAGLLAALAGPPRIGGETSKDAFLRRVGAWQALRETYVHRFGENWRRYAPIMNTGLVLGGATHGRGFSRRFLLAWIVLTAIAVPAGVVTGWFPPDRVLTFAFCIPLLASVGLVWLGRLLGRWWFAWPVGIVLVALTALPTLRAWDEETPFIAPGELRSATIAGRIAATTPDGTPIVFVVHDDTSDSLFLASHALNVARATAPSGRVHDVSVFVGTVADLRARRPTLGGSRLGDLASVTSLQDIPASPEPAIFVIPDFDRDQGALTSAGLTRWDPLVASSLPDARPLPSAEDELAPASPRAMASAAIRVMLLLIVVGFGWARWSAGDLAGALAVAPAFGIATLAITTVALERMGLGLGAGTGTFASALAGAGGYLLAWLRRRTTHAR
ncbi:MAG: hypothetical protein WD096_00570 [Actinomycetota bacterium]